MCVFIIHCDGVFPDGMCEDTAGFVDSLGLNCSSNFGSDCLDEALFTEEYGYSLEDWLDIVLSCPESCGLCESSGENMESAVPQPYSL